MNKPDSLRMQLVYTDNMVNIETKTIDQEGDFNIGVIRNMSINGGHGVGAQCNPYDGVNQQDQEDDLIIMGQEIANAIFKYKDKYGIK